MFTAHPVIEEAQSFHADVKRRMAAFGRAPDALKIMPRLLQLPMTLTGGDKGLKENCAGPSSFSNGPNMNAAFLADQLFDPAIAAKFNAIMANATQESTAR